MKKFLSLALALIMTMSLVTIGTSATFTDDDSITYAEAVDVMAAIEVIGGYADGSFAPTATLTRGAAAKIICNLVLGPTTAGALIADAAPFPDVATSHVFAGYIAYCANQGILSGYADGNFVPDGTVTGYQFMKMLLGALGYDASIEGFTGDNWSVNVAKLAIAMGLDDGNEDYVGTAAMTREEACLYAFNLLTATMVEYDNNSSVTVGDIVITSSSTAKEVTISEDNDKATISKDGYVQFAEKYFSDLDMHAGEEDVFGRPVTVWDLDGDEIGSYVDYADLEAAYVGKVTKGDMYTLLGSSLYKDLIAGDASLTVWVDGDDDNYVTIKDADQTEETEYAVKKSSTSSIQDLYGNAITGNSAEVEVYYDSDIDAITVVIINTYVVQADADYSTSNEYLKIDRLHAELVIDDATIYNDDVTVEDFEEDDYILVTVAAGEIQTATLAEVIVGDVSAYVYESSVTVDGSKYSYNSTIEAENDNGKSVVYSVGDETALVLDQYGNVIYVDEAITASDNYLFVTDFEQTGTFGKAYYGAAYFADGSYEEIEVDEYEGESVDSVDNENDVTKLIADGEEASENSWFAFSQNSDGTYDLFAKDSDYKVSNIDLTATKANDQVIFSSKTTFANDGTYSMKGDSNTVFVIYDGDDVYSYTGVTNVPDIAIDENGKTISVYGLIDGSYADYVFINTDGIDVDIDDTEATSTDYMMMLDVSKASYDENGDKYYTYDAYVDGEVTEVLTDSNTYKIGYVYNNVKTSNGYITDADVLTLESNVVAGLGMNNVAVAYSGDILIINGTSLILEDTDVVLAIYNADDDDYDVYDLSAAKSIISTLDSATIISGNYFAVLADDDLEEVETLFLYIEDSVEATVVDIDVATRTGDYATAYTTAGISVDGADFDVSAFNADALDETGKALLKGTDMPSYYWYGITFEIAEDAESFEVYINGESAGEYDVTDGVCVDGDYIHYFAIAPVTVSETTPALSDATWDVYIEWFNVNNDLLGVSAVTASRTV